MEEFFSSKQILFVSQDSNWIVMNIDDTGELKCGENIKVVVRVRPPLSEERHDTRHECIEIQGSQGVVIATKPQAKEYFFDHVAGPQSTQFQLFETVGRPISERILAGYNGTIFAYGQTGSGKTHTMQGPLELSDTNWEQRGLIPRVLDYLFDSIARIEDESGGKVRFLVKCSYLEIYNERMNDLLNPEAVNIMLQEDINLGVKIVNASQEIVSNSAEALDLMEVGSRNRRVACTAMNRQSSRSHSVFTLYLQSQEFTSKSKIRRTKTSSFNLIDLAGSERQRDTDTSGERLREAGRINRSLSALGNVITALVDVENGKKRHVRYRDSKLTFLLKDSIGGNSLTYLIATISPLGTSMGESLSTLKFAARAKTIKNQARINQFDSGNGIDEETQRENQILKEKVFDLQEQLKNLTNNPLADNSGYGSKDDLLNDVLNQVSDLRDALERNHQKVEKLEELNARLDQQDRSNKLVRKMLKTQIEKLHQQLLRMQSTGIEADELKSVLKTHFEAHDQEIRQFEQQLLTNPEVLRHLIEKEELQEKLDLLDQSQLKQLKDLESFNRRLSAKCVELLQQNDQVSTECEFLKKNAKLDFDAKDLPSLALLEAQNEQLSKVIVSLREKIAHMEEQSFQLETQHEDVDKIVQLERESNAKELEKISRAHKAAVNALESENEYLKSQIKTLEGSISPTHSTDPTKADVAQLVGTIEDLENRCTVQENVIRRKETEAKAIDEKLHSLTEMQQTLTTKLSRNTKELALKSAQYEEVLCQLENIQEDHECLIQQVCFSQSTCKELQTKLDQARSDLEKGGSRIAELEALSSNSHDKAIVRKLEDEAENSLRRIKSLELKCDQVESLQMEKDDLGTALSSLQRDFRKLSKEYNEKLVEKDLQSQRSKDVILDLMVLIENAQKEVQSKTQEKRQLVRTITEMEQTQCEIADELRIMQLLRHQSIELRTTRDLSLNRTIDSREFGRIGLNASQSSLTQSNSTLKDDLRKLKVALNLSEFEKRELSQKCDRLEEQVADLNDEIGRLAGHQNPGQRIQHHVRVKQENNQLKMTVNKLEKQIWSLKKKIELGNDKWKHAVPLSESENMKP